MLGLMPLVAVAFGILGFKNMFAAFGLYHLLVCMAVPAAHIAKSGENPVLALAAGKNNPATSVRTGVISGMIFIVFIFIFFAIFGTHFLFRDRIADFLTSLGYSKSMLLPLAAYFIFFNSVVEELFWRGFYQSHVRRDFGPAFTGVWVSFFFIQYHFLTIWLLFSPLAAFVFTPVLFLVSYIWCGFREKYGNVYAPVIGHLCADFAVIVVFYRLTSS
jgi:membrane protease YdiL (CAAX protease family)